LTATALGQSFTGAWGLIYTYMRGVRREK
jgi:hypothetical protein